jgi:hypothetical protein
LGAHIGDPYAPTRSAVTALRTPPRAVWAGLVGPFGFSFSFVVAIFSFFLLRQLLRLISDLKNVQFF